VSARATTTDRRIAALPVRECGEPLVDLCTVASLRVDPRMARTSPTGGLVRASVVDRLVTAQSLLPRGLRLLLLDGLCDEAGQRSRQADRAVRLRGIHPEWSMQQVLDEAGWHCSGIWHGSANRHGSATWDDSAMRSSAPHSTGAAVDITLCSETGEELPMGCPPQAGPVESGGACHTDAPVPAGARANRDSLRTALTAVGLVNQPEAWWHWSYGDQFWCYVTAAPAARYGPVPAT
jgi:D-alanyl-D-alanine dipeptidase